MQSELKWETLADMQRDFEKLNFSDLSEENRYRHWMIRIGIHQARLLSLIATRLGERGQK